MKVYEILNTFSSYLKAISKSFYCKNAKVYISRIYSPNCDLKLWIIFEFGNLLHRFIDHATFLYIKACKDSVQFLSFDSRDSLDKVKFFVYNWLNPTKYKNMAK